MASTRSEPADPGRPPGPAVGERARADRAVALDAWLAGLLPEWPTGVSLAAIGGLGRRDSGPHSDVDLLLIHSGQSGIGSLADSVWYPIWDARMRLDHAVRTVPEALGVARKDPRVALALLDIRPVAGDPAPVGELRRTARDQWRRDADRCLPALRASCERRWSAQGELAYLLEGDVKEARGGLRDIGVLYGIGLAGVTDRARPAVRAAHTRLLDVRDAVQVATGRWGDRLVAQDRATVAALLDCAGRDALPRRVAQDARTVCYALDDAWRAVERWRSPRARTVRRPLGRDVVAHDGEVVLARSVIGPRPDPALPLRVASAAAVHRLPVGRATLEWLARFATPLPVPWPASARDALLTLLGSGAGLVPVWEACDRHGLVDTWLPEWTRLRSLPQYNPVHLYTVDRHLVQTAAVAGAGARQVSRPDLLVLGALLHDVGKGLPGDHSVAGAPVAAAIARRIGLPAVDVDTIARMVELHLLLPETATRRDVTDPVTVARTAAVVRDVSTLDLLHRLAVADAAATGPGAWSPWKGRLVDDLVDRVRRTLDTGAPPPMARPVPLPLDDALSLDGALPLSDALPLGDALPAVRVGDDEVTVIANGRRGLLAAVAGCLAQHRLGVVTADVSTPDGRTVVRCAVQPRFGAPPDPVTLAADLRRAVLAPRAGPHRTVATPGSSEPPAVLVWHRGEATDAVVLEVRAVDSPGLLHRVATALDGVGATVRAARVSTLGGAAVDTFYLVGEWSPAEVEAAVLDALR